LFDLPTGAVIVVTLLGTMILAVLLALALPKGARAAPAGAMAHAAE
jgi:hypothetical protein